MFIEMESRFILHPLVIKSKKVLKKTLKEYEDGMKIRLHEVIDKPTHMIRYKPISEVKAYSFYINGHKNGKTMAYCEVKKTIIGLICEKLTSFYRYILKK